MQIIIESVIKVELQIKEFKLEHILQAHDKIMIRYNKKIESIWVHPKIMMQLQDMLSTQHYSMHYMGYGPMTLFGIKIEVDNHISEDIVELRTMVERMVSK